MIHSAVIVWGLLPSTGLNMQQLHTMDTCCYPNRLPGSLSFILSEIFCIVEALMVVFKFWLRWSPFKSRGLLLWGSASCWPHLCRPTPVLLWWLWPQWHRPCIKGRCWWTSVICVAYSTDSAQCWVWGWKRGLEKLVGLLMLWRAT